MNSLWQDIRYGIQMLLKKPGFTATAVLALALGIGVNAGVFSSVNALLLNPLPFSDVDRIVAIFERVPSQGVDRNEASPANYMDWRNQSTSFENVGLYRWWGVNLTDHGTPERVQGFLVTSNLLDVLETKPMLGRGFVPEEDQPGNDRVVILTYGLWQRRFASDPNIIGKTIAVNSVERTIVGVMPREYNFPQGAQVLAPIAFTPEQAANRANHSYLCVARLKHGVSMARAQADLDNLSARLQKEYPETNTGRSARIVTLLDDTVRIARPGILIMMFAVAFVLLIGCANVANLMLARATGRVKEIAIRAALGASRWRIIRQLLVESIMLALIGGAVGVLVAYWTINLMKTSMPSDVIPFISNWQGFTLDLPVLGFTLGVSIVAGALFGLAPALQMSRPDLNEALKESGGKLTSGRHLLRGLLVVSEMALSLVLLVGAGLMLKGFISIMKTDPGLKPDNVLTMNLVLPTAKYGEAPMRAAFFNELIRKVESLPGVESAGVVNHLPLAGTNSSTNILIEGIPDPPPGQEFDTGYRVCTPDYFQALGIRLIKGRSFTDQDRADTQLVTIVNNTLAKTYWPNQDPIGRRIRLNGPLNENPWRTVVGVIADVKRDMEMPVTPEFYFPEAQDPWSTGVLVARTRV
ncbi:MAG TPA: ABC transporter permease, partial [Blastocatellia bacterium]|nr:ABC transporter permease [Blastocatellia bacterium]